MNCPPEMAFSFISKWREDHTLLVVMLSTQRFGIKTAGSIVAGDENGIHLMFLAVKDRSGEVTEAPGELIISFRDSLFEYTEPREAPEVIREESESMMVFMLTVRGPLDKREDPPTPEFILTLTELTNQPKEILPIGS
jgi:hypothetical protein